MRNLWAEYDSCCHPGHSGETQIKEERDFVKFKKVKHVICQQNSQMMLKYLWQMSICYVIHAV